MTAPMPENTVITNSAEFESQEKQGYYEFGEIEFTKPGEYVYTVAESGKVENVTNDSKSKRSFTFTVTEDSKGKLSVTPDTNDAAWTFTNVYKEPKPGIKVKKTVTSKPANGSYYKKGETVEYKIVVTNTGNSELTDVVVTDELTGDEWTLDTLAIGASETFTTKHKVTDADVTAGQVLNKVTATGKDPYGNKVTDDDDVTVDTGKVKNVVPPKKHVPQTGDDAPITGLVIVALASAAVMVGAARKRSDGWRHAKH